MRNAVAVLIPVLGRPHLAAKVVASLAGSVVEVPARPVFLCSPGDADQIAASALTGAEVLVMPWEAGRGDYARKMNHGFAATDEQWVFLAADDLVFHPGWLERCLGYHQRTHACVIGTNDLGNARVVQGKHSTHTLVHRDYWECGTIDEDGKILHESYHHNYADDEFVQTARSRRTIMFARDAIVEHLHPDWGKATWDDTYTRGKEHFYEDRDLFESRQHLWLGFHPRKR